MVGTTAKVKSVKVDLKKTLLLCTLEVKFLSRFLCRLLLITVIPGSQRQRLFWAPLEEVIDVIEDGANVKQN
jgi:hypothetical protein